MNSKEKRKMNKQRKKTDWESRIETIENWIITSICNDSSTIIKSFENGDYNYILEIDFDPLDSYLFANYGLLRNHLGQFEVRLKNELDNTFLDIDIKKVSITYDDGTYTPDAIVTIIFEDEL